MSDDPLDSMPQDTSLESFEPEPSEHEVLDVSEPVYSPSHAGRPHEVKMAIDITASDLYIAVPLVKGVRSIP